MTTATRIDELLGGGGSRLKYFASHLLEYRDWDKSWHIWCVISKENRSRLIGHCTWITSHCAAVKSTHGTPVFPRNLLYILQFLSNHNRLALGNRQSGEAVDDVVLPPWASGDALVGIWYLLGVVRGVLIDNVILVIGISLDQFSQGNHKANRSKLIPVTVYYITVKRGIIWLCDILGEWVIWWRGRSAAEERGLIFFFFYVVFVSVFFVLFCFVDVIFNPYYVLSSRVDFGLFFFFIHQFPIYHSTPGICPTTEASTWEPHCIGIPA